MEASNADFLDLGLASAGTVSHASGVASSGTKRNWLKVYETLPCQPLNGYGQAKYVKISEKEMWEQMHSPLRSGVSCMSELCLEEKDRRGVGINRWLQPLQAFLMYQNEDMQKTRNKMILNEGIFKSLYEEIDKILPSVSYCLAPRKGYKGFRHLIGLLMAL